MMGRKRNWKEYNEDTAGVEVDGFRYSVSYNIRSDLASGIEENWVGHENSNIGHQYLDLKDGKIVKGKYLIERTDIIIVQGEQCNVFVEADGYISVQPWSSSKPNKARDGRARRAAEIAYAQGLENGYVENERKFLTEKPWLKCDGLSPEDAVELLRPYEYTGWEPGDDPVGPQRDDATVEMDNAVADALTLVANAVRRGIPLEEISIEPADADEGLSMPDRVHNAVAREVVSLLQAHRAFGSELDRIKNRRGAVLFPVELLTTDQQLGNIEERYGL